MQFTITLNHLIILIICGSMLAIAIYAFQAYKKISTTLSAIVLTVSPFQDRVNSIAERMETVTLNMQYLNSIWTEWKGRDQCCSRQKEFT